MEREHNIDGKTWCYLHPEELIIGVCALCLHQRLLVLSKKQHNNKHKSSSSVSSIYLHKVFAFRSLLDRKRKPDESTTASISQQESFISINLEDNNIASSSSAWKKKVIEDDGQRSIIKSSSVKEHTKRGSRWRNRIGHWLEVLAWKKRKTTTSNSAKVVNANSHVGSKLGNVKMLKHPYIHT